MSSLHYLKDHDLIELLGDYVLKAYLRKKKKDLEESRKYHEKNFQDCIDVNKENHYLISDVIFDIKHNYPLKYPKDSFIWSFVKQCKTIPNECSRLYIDLSWTPLRVSDIIKIYNNHKDTYKENTKLQRCGY